MINTEILEIVLPAFATGLLCTALHAPLGIEVLRRGIVFIDLATAQVAGVAIVALNIWVMDPSWAGTQVAAFGAAVAFAFLFRWIERTIPDEQEAAIGSCFIVAASVTLLLLVNSPHGGEKLEHILSGQILFTSWSDLAAFLPVYLLVAGLWLGYPALRDRTGFLPTVCTCGHRIRSIAGRVRRLREPDSAGNGRAPGGRLVQSVACPVERRRCGHCRNSGIDRR